MAKAIAAIFAAIIFLLPLGSAVAQEEEPVIADTIPVEEYYLGEITEIVDEEDFELGGIVNSLQTVKVRIEKDGQEEELIIDNNNILTRTPGEKLKVGDMVVIGVTKSAFGETTFLADRYRLPALIAIFALFAVLVIAWGRYRGFASLLAMVASIAILAVFTVPQILEGKNPLLVSIASAVAIAVFTLYLAHGVNKRTSIALLSTLITLGIAGGLAVAFVSFARLFGLGSEEAFFLQVLQSKVVNLKGLLLGGILIAALGVIDDVTTTQAAAVEELRLANPGLKFRDLYRRGSRVGRAHIASVVNTLVLAYAGAGLPLFILFLENRQAPWWVVLNSELIAEEVIRTLVGSTALVLAVPVATLLAAYFFAKKAESDKLNTDGISTSSGKEIPKGI